MAIPYDGNARQVWKKPAAAPEQDDDMRSPRCKQKSIFSICFNIGLLLLLSSALFLAGLVLYLQQRPEELATLLTEEIRKRSGLACDVQSVGVALVPSPALALVNVDIRDARFTLSSPYATIRPRLMPLLHGTFLPDEISLFQARCFARPEKGGDAEPAPQGQQGGGAPKPPPVSALPPFMDGCALVLRQSSLHLETPQLVLKVEDIDGRVLFDAHALRGEMAATRTSLAYASWPELNLGDVRLELQEAFHAMRGNTAGPGGRLRMTGRAEIPGMLSAAAVEFAVQEDAGPAGIHMQARVQGSVPARGAGLPVHARLAAGGTPEAFKVEALELRLADDVFTLAGLFEPGQKTPVFSGRLEFEAFSLPRYFAFARRLPPGIRHSLDRLNGYMEFRMEDQGITVPKLRCATSHGAIFTGRGGVEHFARPEIFLDVQTSSVNLDEEFPEISRSGVTPPEYRHEPLVWAPGSPGHTALPDIGYDIRIRAAQAVVASSRAGELTLRCSPGAGGPLLKFDAKTLFGGQAHGSLAVSRKDGAPSHYALELNAQKLKLALMEKLLPNQSRLAGLVSGSADVRFAGDDQETALSRLGGTFFLRLEEGFHDPAEGTKAERVPLPVCALSGTFQSQGRQGDRLGYTGKWQAEIQDGDWRLDAQLDGPLSIALKGVFPLRLSRVPGTLRVQRTTAWKGFMPQGLAMECAGKFSLDSEHSSAAVEEARARLFDCALTGRLRGTYAKEGFEAQGRIDIKGTSLRQTLAKLGMEAVGLNPALLKDFSGAAAVAVSPGKLALSEMEGRIDQSRFSGSLSGQWAQRPAWQGEVQVDALDLQSYLDTGPAPQKGKAWDLKFLQDFDAKGVVAVQSLRMPGIHFRQARSPVQLNSGVLELAPITASLYGGPVTARIRLNAKEAPGIQMSARASGIDLRDFTDERGMNTVYEGKASVQLELAGPASSGADIPAGLNGRFFCESGSGSMQARKTLQQKEASPTRFDKIVISGPVERGVFRSERFQLDGPALRVGGGGRVNMPEETLDLKLKVHMAGLPAFPVHVYGKIDKPQTSVQAGQAFVQAVGKLGLGIVDGIETVGSGLLDVIGSVLSAPFKLLK